MNKWTWDVAPRGKQAIRIITFGEKQETAREAAVDIAHDIWPETKDAAPGAIIGTLVSVEQVYTPINYEPVFING